MNRRSFVMMVGVGILLPGCQGATLPTFPVDIKISLPPEIKEGVDWAADIVNKLDSLKLVFPAKIQKYIDDGKALLAKISAAVSVNNVKDLLAQLVSIVQQVLGYLPSSGSAPDGSTWGKILDAINTALPIVMKVAGIVVPMFLRRQTTMAPAEARLVLRRR